MFLQPPEIKCYSGMVYTTKTDEFLEMFQTAFDPPPHFRKIMLRFFSGRGGGQKLFHIMSNE